MTFLKFTLTELEQNVYRADLTARGILRLLHSKREMHFFAFRNPSLSILLLSPEVVALTFQIRGLARCCVFCQRFLNGGPTRSASLPDFLVHIRRSLFFRISAKKRQRIASSSSGGISSKRLPSLRRSFHSLKTFSHVFVLLAVFEFSFLLLRVLISSSCNHGNLSFVLELLKMEKFGKFSSLNSSMLSTTMATCPSFSADVCSLLIGWFHNLLFFSDFIG